MNRKRDACVREASSWSTASNSMFERPFSVSAAAVGQQCADVPGSESPEGGSDPGSAARCPPFACHLPTEPLGFREWLLSF